MGSRRELSLETVREFILQKGGKVTNHDLVKHFKDALTNPDTRADARNEFKEIVNTLATIVKSEEGEKYLILKKRFRQPDYQAGGSRGSVVSPPPTFDTYLGGSLSSCPGTPAGLSAFGGSFSASQDSFENFFTPTNRQPPPYRPPPPPVSPTTPKHQLMSRSASVSSLTSSSTSSSYHQQPPPPYSSSSPPPPVPPRRKSSERIRMDTFNNNIINTGSNKENIAGGGAGVELNKRPKTIGAEAETEETTVDAESKITVKECMQKFNRLASESALQRAQFPANKKKSGKETPERDEDDSVSLDPKAREWQVRAAQCNYQALAKMAGENHRLARLKCPFTGYTALHWAAKHGNEDVVKLLAGTYKVEVNSVTNGGYTPLHLAMQFGHEEIYNLLVQVYGADPNLRDHSGRKARQYQTNKDTAVSADTFRKIKARKKHAEKDLGFLRIGSLNVRVKRTTEAFSNFLGVGNNMDKLHKTWGSADNIPLDDNSKMPPPKFAPIKKRKSRRGQDFTRFASQGSSSGPELTENEANINSLAEEESIEESVKTRERSSSAFGGNDSDSDTAAGFGSNWQKTV